MFFSSMKCVDELIWIKFNIRPRSSVQHYSIQYHKQRNSAIEVMSNTASSFLPDLLVRSVRRIFRGGLFD